MWAICFCVSVLLFDLMFHLGKHGIAWPWPKAHENKTHLLYAGGMLAASQYNIYIYTCNKAKNRRTHSNFL